MEEQGGAALRGGGGPVPHVADGLVEVVVGALVAPGPGVAVVDPAGVRPLVPPEGVQEGTRVLHPAVGGGRAGVVAVVAVVGEAGDGQRLVAALPVLLQELLLLLELLVLLGAASTPPGRTLKCRNDFGFPENFEFFFKKTIFKIGPCYGKKAVFDKVTTRGFPAN